MNNFRVKLHSALFERFDVSPGWQSVDHRLQPKNPEVKETEEAMQEFQETVATIEESVTNNPELKNIAWNMVSKVSREYMDDMWQLQRDRIRFNERVKMVDSSWKRYADLWNEKIGAGYNHLINQLNKNHYFDNHKNSLTKAEVLVKYSNEVEKQYRDNVWFWSDKNFNNVKDILFGSDSGEKYPANKVYRELTWAASIFTVDREFTEWYDVDTLDSISLEGDNENDNETYDDKKNRNILSKDLPEYLWNLKKTPWLLKALKWFPLINVKIDKPSEEDKKAISEFLKAANKIPVRDWKDPSIVLIGALHDNRLNTDSTKEKYKEVLEAHWMDTSAFKKEKDLNKCLEAVVKVGRFYLSTQTKENTHGIYLSVLRIIESEWWAANAAKKFKEIVDQSKKDSKKEGKEDYQDGERLKWFNPGLYDVATKLGTTDFTSANRLARKGVDYFQKCNIGQILWNLNNDRVIDARDTFVWWSKTWTQFLETFNQVSKQLGEDAAINNLLERAKLDNKVLWLWIPEAEFTKDQIKSWNTKVIFLLQNIINKPWEDLISLLSGRDPLERVDLQWVREEADKAAAEMIKKMNIEALKETWMHMPTPESMQSWLAASLYQQYTRWVGIWGKISFDEWLKWVEMNTWFQYREDGSLVIWIWLDYHKMVNLWKWWSMTPELSAWAFIPLLKWKPDIVWTGWLNVEIAKERITNNWIKQHLGLQLWAVELLPVWVTVVSAWFNWGQDKLAWIETAEQKKQQQFEKEIMDPILNKLYEKRSVIKDPYATKLDFTRDDLVKDLKESILEVAKLNNVPADKQEMVANNTMRLLLPYNNIDLSDKNNREYISQAVAEQYAMAWAEARKGEISKKGYDISSIWVWMFWVVWAPFVWAYLNVKMTNYDLDGYGDSHRHEYGLDHAHENWRTDELIKEFNDEARFPEGKGLRIDKESNLIVIPRELLHRVNVNEKLKWLMKKDANWNVLLHTQTPMQTEVWSWSASTWSEITIWWGSGDNFQKLDTLWNDWFTMEESIDQNKVLELGDGIRTYTPELINKALEDLKTKMKDSPLDVIHKADFSKLSEQEMQQLIEELNKLDKTKKAKIVIISVDADWKPQTRVEQWVDWRWLELEYQTKFEMMDSKANEVARLVYEETAKVTCQVLHRMCHAGTKWPEYVKFANHMAKWEYTEAKPIIIWILKKLDTEINKQQKNNPVNFSEVAEKINAIEDNISLWQALMSVNNIFARSSKVYWKWVDGNWLNNYEFKIWQNKWLRSVQMGAIIAEREWEISGTIRKKEKEGAISKDAADAYISLIQASSKYRQKNPDKFKCTASKSAQLTNTIWYNLWNSTNPENPLFNPEIYEQTVKLEELEAEWFSKENREALHKHAMELYVNNPVLINPIKTALWLDSSAKVTVDWDFVSDQNNNWILQLDIWWKKVTLKAWMKFWYFTQCVNHIVILDNISAESEDGTSVNFNSWVWERWKYTEWSKSSRVSRTEIGFSVAVTTGKQKQQEEPEDNPWSKPDPGNVDPNDPNTKPWQNGSPIGWGGWDNPGNPNSNPWQTGWPIWWGGWLD